MKKKNRGPQTVTIERLGKDGCGYPAEGKAAVFGALPGETVIASPITFKRKVLYCRADTIDNVSADRVEPLCEVASQCGGCSFQHLDHARQIDNKSALLAEALAPLTPEHWLAPLTSRTSHYRSKARLGVRYVPKKGRVLVGFREKMKPYITDTPACPILVEPVANLITPLADMIAQFVEPDQWPQIEVSCGDDIVAMIFRHLADLADADLARLTEFGQQHNVEIYLQPGGLNTVHAIHQSESQPDLQYSLPDYDLNYHFSPTDFTQVNLEMNRLMVRQALQLLELKPEDQVLDAFCGIGNFSLAIARNANRVLGIEQSAGSIERATQNSALNGIDNASFEVADLHVEVPEINELGRFNKVLLDPPRSGAEALVKVLATSEVERLVYVSCNPDTLARDVSILVDRGFRLQSAGIIDMFPHTTHVESVALLTRQAQNT